MTRLFHILFFSLFLSIIDPIYSKESISLKVNIISHSLTNGAGKEVDVAILKGELERLGHQVHLCDYHRKHTVPQADINLFLSQFKPEWYPRAKLNWYIPNPEFSTATLKDLLSFDLVLCKTKESFRIFKSISHACYVGFASLDHYRSEPSERKDFSRYLHVSGKSRMKGTDEIIRTWTKNPYLPLLVLLRHSREIDVAIPHNIYLVHQRITEENLLNLQNECGIQLCTSKTEGFGHYIMEAMSAEAVVITTDGPPMNEFIQDKRCLVRCLPSSKNQYATLYTMQDEDLAEVVKGLQRLSHDELREIGRKNRQEYLRRCEDFKRNFEKIINKAVKDLS